MDFDSSYYPYPSRRNVVFASRGMVSCSVPQAAQAGLDALKRGGNAVDAAVAAAACLTVVEPISNGVGGDAFAIVWMGGKLHGLNASGPSPRGLTYEMLNARGYVAMPECGWEPVNVPGIPSAWAALEERFGRLSMSETMAPAIEAASEGYPVAVNVAKYWKKNFDKFSRCSGTEFRGFFDQFTVGGRAPEAGEIFRCENLAETLREIADSRSESFYRGRLARRIVDFAKETGGYLSEADLAEYHPEWIYPISVNYRGYDVFEMPPNGHGITVLMALNILSGFELCGRDSALTMHRQIEAIKLAFADAMKYVADPRDMRVKAEEMLSKGYAAERRKLITESANLPLAGNPSCGGTVYLCAADCDGNMVSYIQSNYHGFGSGIAVPGTGITLHNRGCNFSLEAGHDNCYAPGKRPYHTIIPGFLMKDGRPVGPFGVMGAFMQPQGHVQALCNAIDFHLNPQSCLDAPRWQWIGGNAIEAEDTMAEAAVRELASMGHEVKVVNDCTSMGRGQIIWRLDNGAYCGGTEPRADGSIAVW